MPNRTVTAQTTIPATVSTIKLTRVHRSYEFALANGPNCRLPHIFREDLSHPAENADL